VTVPPSRLDQRSRRFTWTLLQPSAGLQRPVHCPTVRSAVSRPRRTSLPTVVLVRLIRSPNAKAARLASFWKWVTGSVDRAGGGEKFPVCLGLGSARVAMAAEAGRADAVALVVLERLTSSMGDGTGGVDCERDSNLIGGRASAGSGRDSNLIGGKAGAGSGREAIRFGDWARFTGLAGLGAGRVVATGCEATLGAGFARATGLDELLSRGAGAARTATGGR
jgi:hypothetical protein